MLASSSCCCFAPGLPGTRATELMPAHRVHPQDQVTGATSLPITKEVPSEQNHKDGSWPPTRRCLLVSCTAFLVLGVVAAAIGLGITFGIPVKPAARRPCKAAPQLPGFLCEDLTTCLLPSTLCNGKADCNDGEDESAAYCGQMPNSLPQNFIFQCSSHKTWIYVDKVCDARNDCGDCSDESVFQCPTCPGWRCEAVSFADCDCIPRTRCKDGVQDCADWSDEKFCE